MAISRSHGQPGKLYVIRQPLVESAQVLLPPLHIKLGLVKQFIKVLDYDGEAFQEILNLFPKLSEAKVKGGIFTGPLVRKMWKSVQLKSKTSDVEKRHGLHFDILLMDSLIIIETQTTISSKQNL